MRPGHEAPENVKAPPAVATTVSFNEAGARGPGKQRPRERSVDAYSDMALRAVGHLGRGCWHMVHREPVSHQNVLDF